MNGILFIIDCTSNESIQLKIMLSNIYYCYDKVLARNSNMYFIGPSPSAHTTGGRVVLSLWVLLWLSACLLFLGPLNPSCFWDPLIKQPIMDRF